MRNRLLFLLVFLIFFVQYFTMNNSPNSWDSAEYSYYVRDVISGDFTSITGSFISNKPLYVLSGVLIFLFSSFFGNDNYQFSLNLVSILFGSLSLIPFFYLAKRLFKSDYYSYLSVILFSFNPLFWWGSAEAMSEIPSMFFLLLSIYLFYKWMEIDLCRFLYLSFFVLGIGLLFRFALVIYLPVFLIVLMLVFLKRKTMFDFYKIFLAMVSFFIPIFSFIVFINIFTGTSGFFRYFSRSIYSSIFTLTNVFKLEVWIGQIYYLINGMSLPLFIFSILGFILLFYHSLKNKISYLVLLLFSLLISVTLIFNAGLPVVLSRYMVFVSPTLILLSVYFVKCFKLNRLWDIFVLFLCSGFLLLNYLDMYELYYGGIYNAVLGMFSNVGIYYFISVLLLFFILVFSLKFKHSSVLTIVLLVLVTTVLHTMPILYLFGENSYVKNISEFYGANLDKGDLIIAGYDKPYDILYAPQAEVIFYRDEGIGTVNSKDKIFEIVDNKLLDGSNVYFSSEHFLVDLHDSLALRYDVDLVGVVSGRGVHDWGSVFMNYWSYKYSEQISIYSLTFKS